MKLDEAARAYNQAFPGFSGGGAVPSRQQLEFQMAKALQYANDAEWSDAYQTGNGYIHRVIGQVAQVAPDAAMLFATSLLENKQQEPLLKSLEFMLASLAERSPETLEHIVRHTALTMQFYVNQNGDITLRNRDEALQVMVGAIAHDAGKIGIHPALLHKQTRLPQARFDALLTAYELQVPSYPQKAHDLQFLAEAQKGRLVFPASVASGAISDEVIDFSAGYRSGERALALPQDVERHGRIMGRIAQKAKQAGIVNWLTDEEQRQLASTQRGTLTPQERQILNSHDDMSALYMRLQTLPQELEAVSQIVSMDRFRSPESGGTGNRLANLIHVTDVFEALTAKRSYKEPYRISDALAIMQQMARKGEMDQPLLQSFVDSGVWQDFATRYQCELGDMDAIRRMQTPSLPKSPTMQIEPATAKWQSLAMPAQQAGITLNINLR